MPPTPGPPHLNGAYYGPPIHPKPHHHRASRGGGPSCNPITCCCSCIFNLICTLLLTAAIFLAVTAIIFYFLFRPTAPKFTVDNATLSQFTLSPSNNTLYYNLAVYTTFRNPNRRIGIYYEQIQTNAMYHGQRLATMDLAGFYLERKSEHNVRTVFDGARLVMLGLMKPEYDMEKSDGVYKIDLKMGLIIRFKILWFKSLKFKPGFVCGLKVPLSYKGEVLGERFERTKCGFDWSRKIW